MSIYDLIVISLGIHYSLFKGDDNHSILPNTAVAQLPKLLLHAVDGIFAVVIRHTVIVNPADIFSNSNDDRQDIDTIANTQPVKKMITTTTIIKIIIS